MKAQGVPRDSMPFKSPFQPYLAYAGTIMFSLVILFNGWQIFTTGNWATTDFITAYIGVPIFFVAFAFWKIFKKTKWHKSADVDLWTGKAAIDNEYWPEQIPKNIIEKFWFWLC
jgi:amino acid transporter